MFFELCVEVEPAGACEDSTRTYASVWMFGLSERLWDEEWTEKAREDGSLTSETSLMSGMSEELFSLLISEDPFAAEARLHRSHRHWKDLSTG